MSWQRNFSLYAAVLLLAHLAGADVVVQLNINRPINDVSEKFVSFTMKPEHLYKALDSSRRKPLTRMASMLSNSYVKFVGDYYFANKIVGIPLRNPTNIIWKGFNKWTRSVSWSMIIPAPYKPGSWDPMDSLKVLNISQMVGINEAVWQLGTDFGATRAADYVNDLKTFNIMVDSFKETVTNWQVMGADISSGSNSEETRRYVEMSRNLNAAYGWIQSEDLFSSNSLDIQDPALRVLFKSKVPIWLSLPKKTPSPLDDEVIDGLIWAKTMGEAANAGFDTIFKSLSLDDMEQPNYSFFVTALFKKIMGSRVYPARLWGRAGRSNKLYTHCANMVSGGLAFMVVNKQTLPLQITVSSMNLEDTEVWQYTLTMQNGQIMLNNNNLFINSTLMPEVRRKSTRAMLQLNTPAFSVSFWVLPNANLEHCHFTEVEAPIPSADNNYQKIKQYSSSDRLLTELIKKTTKPFLPPMAEGLRRQRRSVDKEDRFKRFVLRDTNNKDEPSTDLARNLGQESKPLGNDIIALNRRIAAIEWLSSLLQKPRNARQLGLRKDSSFVTRDGKKSALTNKITAIQKPEKKIKQILLNGQEFDEEKFLKTVSKHIDSEYVHVPDGDMVLTNMGSVRSDELEDEEIETEKPNKAKIQKKEIASAINPLLSTKFVKELPPKVAESSPSKLTIGSLLNALASVNTLGKSYSKATNKFNLKDDSIAKNPVKTETKKDLDVEMEASNEDDFLNTQFDIIQKVLKETAAAAEYEIKDSEEKDMLNILDVSVEKFSENAKPRVTNYLYTHNSDSFDDTTNMEGDKGAKIEDKSLHATNEKVENIPSVNILPKRLKRSLNPSYTEDSWQNNVIDKNDDPIKAEKALSPVHLQQFEANVEEILRNNGNHNNSSTEDGKMSSIGKKIVNTFTEQVTRLVDIFSHQASEWYRSFAKQWDNPIIKETMAESHPAVLEV